MKSLFGRVVAIYGPSGKNLEIYFYINNIKQLMLIDQEG